MDWHTVAAFVLGAAAGALVIYLLRHRFNDTQVLRSRLSDLQSELESYRSQVDEHFERTSDLFQEVTQKYRSLHDHLAQGATGLTRGAKRLPSIELPEKAMLPAQPEHEVDAANPSVAIVDVSDPPHEQTADAKHQPAPEVTGEIPQETDQSVAGENTIRR